MLFFFFDREVVRVRVFFSFLWVKMILFKFSFLVLLVIEVIV